MFASCRQLVDCERLRAEGFDSPHLDYLDPQSIESAVAEVLAATGGTLDALYNNGAHGIPAAVEDLSRPAFNAILEANLVGPHHLTTLVIPVMRAQGHGRIVNCTSVMGYVALKWRGAYVATKFALEGLTDTLRVELHGTGIHVSLIEPGLITTQFGKNSRLYFEKWVDWKSSAKAAEYDRELLQRWDGKNPVAKLEAPPSHVTKTIIHALESRRPRPRYRITKLAKLAYVLKRLLPTRATDWIIRRVS